MLWNVEQKLKKEIGRVERLREKYQREIIPKVPSAAVTEAFITDCLARAWGLLRSRNRKAYAPIIVELQNYRD